MAKICIVEDDVTLRDELSRILSLQGHESVWCDDFRNASAFVVEQMPNLLIVDLRLPGNDGLNICRDVREQSNIPILVLTSSDSEFDEVMSMKLGADDFVNKPYSPAVLLAHIDRLLERSDQGAQSLMTYLGIVLDASRSTVSFNGCLEELSRNEIKILAMLIRAEGKIVSRQELMYELWQSDEFVDDNTLTVNVNRLRKVLEKVGVSSDMLKTHRGQGYSL